MAATDKILYSKPNEAEHGEETERRKSYVKGDLSSNVVEVTCELTLERRVGRKGGDANVPPGGNGRTGQVASKHLGCSIL